MTSPLQEFKKYHKERWTVLQDLPSWEVESVLNWLRNVFVYDSDDYLSRRDVFNYPIVRGIETANRLVIPDDLQIDTSSWSAMRSSLEDLLREEEFNTFITFLECVVKYVRDVSDGRVMWYKHVIGSEEALVRLEVVLERGSKWKIVFERGADAGLVERVSSEITEIAMSLGSDHLTKAWNEAFSVNPKPDKAIESAQKAIEAIASERGLTSVKTSVYGNLLGDIKTNPDKYISVAHTAYQLSSQLNNDAKNPIDFNELFANWFWTGLELIQKTNPGRHSSDKTKGFILSPEAGKQATLIATIICQLISSEYFTKISKEKVSN